MRMIKNNRGVTIVALTITVMIIIIITSLLIYNANDNVYIKRLTNMYNDISNLRDKVASYYEEYGDIPAKTRYTKLPVDIAPGGDLHGANDSDVFYVIDLDKLDGLTLNYGKDYEKLKSGAQVDDLTDIYIINEKSHNIFYAQGIQVKEGNTTNVYYTDEENIDTVTLELKKRYAGPTKIDGVTIPKGFYYVGGSKDTGIVISDNEADMGLYKDQKNEVDSDGLQGNQFVWVPVEDFSKFKRKAGYSKGKLQAFESVSSGLTEGKFYEPEWDGKSEKTESDKMYKSVKDNKGFYVARYEAGVEDNVIRDPNLNIDDKLIIRKTENVYNYVGWANTTDMTNEKGGAVELSRNMYTDKSKYGVTSTLIYGVQWDAIVEWMSDINNTNSGNKYIIDSTGMGNYTGHQEGTGTNDLYRVKNIYDLAGNMYEWTMEAYGLSQRAIRGGCYYGTTSLSMSERANVNQIDNNDPSEISFRVALYL